MDAQNFDALVDFRFAPAFWHWRRIDIKPFDFNETVRLEAVGKLYRSIASGSVGKRNRFVSIARLRITTESNFAWESLPNPILPLWGSQKFKSSTSSSTSWDIWKIPVVRRKRSAERPCQIGQVNRFLVSQYRRQVLARSGGCSLVARLVCPGFCWTLIINYLQTGVLSHK